MKTRMNGNVAMHVVVGKLICSVGAAGPYHDGLAREREAYALFTLFLLPLLPLLLHRLLVSWPVLPALAAIFSSCLSLRLAGPDNKL